MALEPLPETKPPCEDTSSDQPAGGVTDSPLSESEAAELPVELSEFSQRLASFGLGETPDPLLTESRSPATRRSRT